MMNLAWLLLGMIGGAILYEWVKYRKFSPYAARFRGAIRYLQGQKTAAEDYLFVRVVVLAPDNAIKRRVQNRRDRSS